MANLFQKILHQFSTGKDTAPEPAYNLWAANYDSQPGNLMLALDEEIFHILMKKINIQAKTVADIGCGTGRHWQYLMDRLPKELTGYDVSAGMLAVLKKKFPAAVTHKLSDNRLLQTPDLTVDLLLSTLTMAHIENSAEAMQEWNRVVKPGADIIITDYHPDILQQGGKRSFKVNDKTMSVKNYIHTVETIKSFAAALDWTLMEQLEKKIDDSVKHFYEQQNALQVFESFKGMPVIYGLHFKKAN